MCVLFAKIIVTCEIEFSVSDLWSLRERKKRASRWKPFSWCCEVFFRSCITFDECIYIPVLRNNFPFGSWVDVKTGMWGPRVRGQGWMLIEKHSLFSSCCLSCELWKEHLSVRVRGCLGTWGNGWVVSGENCLVRQCHDDKRKNWTSHLNTCKFLAVSMCKCL